MIQTTLIAFYLSKPTHIWFMIQMLSPILVFYPSECDSIDLINKFKYDCLLYKGCSIWQT